MSNTQLENSTVNGKVTVKKIRSKVSKACESCRRRKIKCSGSNPCTSCLAYECDCIFTDTSLISGSSFGTTSNNNSGVNISQMADSTDSTNFGDNNINGNTKNKNRIHKRTSSNSTRERGLMFDVLMKDRGNKKHVNGGITLDMLPNIKITDGENGFYENDLTLQKKLIDLQNSIKVLKKLNDSDDNKNIKTAIDVINNEIESTIKNWEPTLDYTKFNKIHKNEVVDKSTDSLETHLLKNKYTDHVHLTKYSVWTDKNYKYPNSAVSHIGTVSSHQPLIDEIFGLYSPFLSFSFRGIGYMFQKAIHTKEANGDSSRETEQLKIQMKESVYILLRFFDLCLDHMTQSCISIGNPLESYLQRKHLLAMPSTNNTPITNTPSSIANSVSSPGVSNNKELLVTVIKRFSQPFLLNLTNGITIDELLANKDDNFKMFALILRIFQMHTENYEDLMFSLTTSVSRESNVTIEISTQNVEDFINYSKEEELLLALCYYYYNSTIYHFNDFRSLEYLEVLIHLLEMQIWLDEFYAIEKVLDVALNYSKRMGLSRWEYYVGVNEVDAERRRIAWWKLYCIEKSLSMEKGIQSSINDSYCNSLLTNEFRDAGFIDIKAFISNINPDIVQSSTDVFNKMSIDSLLSYGKIAIAVISSDFYEAVLFNEKYTSIMNYSKLPFIKIQLSNEIHTYLNTILQKMDAVKMQLARLFEIAFCNDANHSCSTGNQKKDVFTYVFLFFYTFCTLLNSTSNLLARFYTTPLPKDFATRLEKYHNLTIQVWSNMNTLISSIDNDYTVARCFKYYGVISLFVISKLFKGDTILDINHLNSILIINKRFQRNSIFTDNKNNDFVSDSKTFKDLNRSTSFISVVAHLMIVSYIRDKKMSKAQIIQKIEEMNPCVADLIRALLDPKSDVFEYIMKPVKESGFHLTVRGLISDSEEMMARNKSSKTNNRGSINGGSVLINQQRKVSNPYPRNSIVDSKEPFLNQDSLKITSSMNTSSNSKQKGDLQPFSNILQNGDYPNTVGLPILDQFLGSSSVGNDQGVPNVSYVSASKNSADVNTFATTQQFPYLTDNNPTNSYNLGTLDEFINNGDLNDLYNTLWKDLYSNEYI